MLDAEDSTDVVDWPKVVGVTVRGQEKDVCPRGLSEEELKKVAAGDSIFEVSERDGERYAEWSRLRRGKLRAPIRCSASQSAACWCGYVPGVRFGLMVRPIPA